MNPLVISLSLSFIKCKILVSFFPPLQSSAQQRGIIFWSCQTMWLSLCWVVLCLKHCIGDNSCWTTTSQSCQHSKAQRVHSSEGHRGACGNWCQSPFSDIPSFLHQLKLQQPGLNQEHHTTQQNMSVLFMQHYMYTTTKWTINQNTRLNLLKSIAWNETPLKCSTLGLSIKWSVKHRPCSVLASRFWSWSRNVPCIQSPLPPKKVLDTEYLE